MNVLIADADSGIRQVLKRALAKTFGCDVSEAATGLEALDAIARTPTDIVILDVRLPVMDGIEVSEAMRQSEQFRGTPIVMLSAERDADVISHLVRVGVTDVVLKPVRTDRFVTRFGALVSKVMASRLRVTPTSGPPPELAPGANVLLVDGDPEYRSLFEKSLEGQLAITSVGTGAEAISRCMTLQPPKAVFIGKDIGLINPEFLARKLRSSLGARIRLVALVGKREVDAVREQAWPDSVVPRSFVATTLVSEIKKLLQQASSINQFNSEFTGLRLTLLSAAEQVAGLMLNAEVEATEGQLKIDRERTAYASINIFVGSFTLHLKLRFGFDAGRYVSAAFLGVPIDQVTEDDVESVAGELGNVIASRLHSQYVKSGINSVMSLPSLGVAEVADADEPFDSNSTICQAFNAVYSPLAFEVRACIEHTPSTTLPASPDEESLLVGQTQN